jgi:hypothetical protein
MYKMIGYQIYSDSFVSDGERVNGVKVSLLYEDDDRDIMNLDLHMTLDDADLLALDLHDEVGIE